MTGGTSGIGIAVASAFAAAGRGGHRHRDPCLGRRLRRATSRRFTYRQLQIRDHDAVDDAGRGASTLDVLVNNAGANFPDGKDEWDPDGFSAALDLNVEGAMRLTVRLRAALAASAMAGGASVVNIVSMTAFRSTTIVPGYSAAKAALLALTRNLAVHWVGRRHPGQRGGARADRHADDRADEGVPRDAREPSCRAACIRRMGTPEEVAAAVLFLSSDASAYTTGAVLAVDGGYLASEPGTGDDMAERDPHRRPGARRSSATSSAWASSTASRSTPSSPSTPCARPRSRAPASTTSGPTTSASGSAVQLDEMDADGERTGLGRMLMFGDCVAVRGQPPADPRPAARAIPRSSTSRSRSR